MIDARIPEARRMREVLAHLPQVLPLAAFVTRENIGGILSGTRKDPGVLIVDVDGNDYHLVEYIVTKLGYKPAIIVVEVNEHKSGEYVMPYDANYVWDGENVEHGASFVSMTKMLRHLGWECFGTTTQGVNAFYVRNDLTSRLCG